MLPKIVISYRRSDSEAITGRIHDCLADHYGADAVYRDVESIPVGKDFRSHFRNAIDDADLFIAIIGPNWRGTRRGRRSRIKEPLDPVRAELQTAMARGIPVIPVLVDDATMPKADELPKDLENFSFHNAATVDPGQDFRLHMERLIRQMDEILSDRLGGTFAARRLTQRFDAWRPVVVPAAIFAAVAVPAVAWWLWSSGGARTGSQSDAWQPPPNRAYWEVDDSIVYLEATGVKRQFYYVESSRDMRAHGVLPGALLFEGVIQQNEDTSDGKTGQSYVGNIFAYFGKCEPRRYEAQGPVLPGPRIELIGMAPRVDKATCQRIDMEERTLVLDFKEKK